MEGSVKKEIPPTRPAKGAFSVLAVQILFIFAVPAFLVLGAGVYLDIGRAVLFSLLGGAFVLSWILVYYRLRGLNK